MWKKMSVGSLFMQGNSEYQKNLRAALYEAICSLDPARVSKEEFVAACWFRDRLDDQPSARIMLRPVEG